MANKCEEAKRALLSFCSSELTSHAANILGLSVILFAFLDVSYQIFGRVPFRNVDYLVKISPKDYFDYAILFTLFLILISGIVFSALRLVFYGRYAHQVIIQEDDPDNPICSIDKLRLEVMDEASTGTFLRIPVGWFSAGISENTPGIKYSFFLGGIISQILFYVIFFNNFSYLMLILLIPSVSLLLIYFWRAGGCDFRKTFSMNCPKCNSPNKWTLGEVKIRNVIRCKNKKCKENLTEEVKDKVSKK